MASGLALAVRPAGSAEVARVNGVLHYQLGNWFVMLSLTRILQVNGHFELTVSDR